MMPMHNHVYCGDNKNHPILICPRTVKANIVATISNSCMLSLYDKCKASQRTTVFI